MTRSTPISKLVVATHNSGKLREFAGLLDMPGVTLVSAGELGLPEPDETGTSYLENAELKARAAAASGFTALADDSGLSVEALDGAPGIYSGRWAEDETGKRDFNFAMRTLEEKLRGKNIQPTGARAAFISVLALAMPDGNLITAEGRVDGTLRFPPTGPHGFGYDPIFVPTDQPGGETRSFGEMTREEKARYSHRARAVMALKEKL